MKNAAFGYAQKFYEALATDHVEWWEDGLPVAHIGAFHIVWGEHLPGVSNSHRRDARIILGYGEHERADAPLRRVDKHHWCLVRPPDDKDRGQLDHQGSNLPIRQEIDNIKRQLGGLHMKPILANFERRIAELEARLGVEARNEVETQEEP